MNNSEIKQALIKAYTDLEPFSHKYKVDFDRYIFSLKLITSIPNIKDKKILDIGTGIGLLPLALKNLNIQTEGLDRYIFPEGDNAMFGIQNISDLQKLWSRNNLKVHNANIFDTNLSQNIETIDVIISEATIEHLKDPKSFLLQCHKLLSKDGYILTTTPNLGTLIKRIRFLFGFTPYWPIEEFFKDGENFTGHWREYTMKELVYMSQKSGFEVVQTHTKNMLTKFKELKDWKKNIRAFITLLSSPFEGMREMHYLLCRRKN